MITTLSNSLVASLNRANPNTLPSQLAALQFGTFLRSMPTHTFAKVPALTPYIVQTGAQAVQLPDDAKAALLVSVYARAGSGTIGALTVDTSSATAPAAGHCSISPSGDIQFASADAWTSVDIFYIPSKGDIYEITGYPVASNTLVLPTKLAGKTALVLKAMEIESLTGTTVKKMQVIAPGGSPSTGQACLNAAKTQIAFASADAVTTARVKFSNVPAVDTDTLLEAASAFI